MSDSGHFGEQVVESVVNGCQIKCINAARDIVEFFNALSTQSLISDLNTLPSHWYIISCKSECSFSPVSTGKPGSSA